MLACEIQEVKKSQISQTLVNNKRLETEKNLQQAVERQGRDIAEMRKQLTLWTRNTSTREAYTCWAHQQANPNLSEIPITQIPDLMQTNAEKGRPMFYGCLKSDYGASTFSQADPQEPTPLRTGPPIPGCTCKRNRDCVQETFQELRPRTIGVQTEVQLIAKLQHRNL
ncbi:hypothetical protein PIB30_100104, partial [Stylosanthes scabra]|nr:hypothetical protein [Stylosanthes scabra]